MIVWKTTISKEKNNEGPKKTYEAQIKKAISNTFKIPSYMIHLNRHDAGFFIGTITFRCQKYYIGIPSTSDLCSHILVVGGSGSGKSSCIAEPTIKSFQGTIIAIDTKGGLIECLKNNESNKKPTKILNLSRKKQIENSYNVFASLEQEDSLFLVQNTREIVNAIVPMPNDIKEPFWIDCARSILTAVILYNLNIKASFNETITYLQTTSLNEIIQEINENDDMISKMFIKQFSDYEMNDSKMMLGIESQLSNAIITFATDNILKEAFMPNADSITWTDFDTHNIFISIDEDMIEQYGSALTMILTQLIRSLERRPEKFSSQGQGQTEILLLLDEFPRYGKMPMLCSALSTLRSRGVKIALFLQSISQLDSIYGENDRNIIMDNCSHKIILRSLEPNNQQYLSRLFGEKEVEKISYSNQYDTKTNELTGRSKQVSKQFESYFRPEEFQTLDRLLVATPEGHFCVDKSPSYKDLS